MSDEQRVVITGKGVHHTTVSVGGTEIPAGCIRAIEMRHRAVDELPVVNIEMIALRGYDISLSGSVNVQVITFPDYDLERTESDDGKIVRWRTVPSDPPPVE